MRKASTLLSLLWVVSVTTVHGMDVKKTSADLVQESQRLKASCNKVEKDLTALPSEKDKNVSYVVISAEQVPMQLENWSDLASKSSAANELRTWFGGLSAKDQLAHFDVYMTIVKNSDEACIQNSVDLARGFARNWKNYDEQNKKRIFDVGHKYFKGEIGSSSTILEASALNSELGLLIKSKAWVFKTKDEKKFWAWFKSVSKEFETFVATQDKAPKLSNVDPTKWTTAEKEARLKTWNAEFKLARKATSELKAYLDDLKPNGI